MTDPKPTTNEEIALELGWYVNEGGFWTNPNDSWDERQDPPDFEHDWARAAPLLEELFTELDWTKAVLHVWAELPNSRDGEKPNLKIAISHAWLAWKKEEK